MKKRLIVFCTFFVILLSCLTFAGPRDYRCYNGWTNNHRTFLVNGMPLLGWQYLNGNWYYFEQNGNCATGWRYNLYWKGDGTYGDYYFDGIGRMLANTFIEGRYLGSNGKVTAPPPNYYYQPWIPPNKKPINPFFR